MRFNKTFCLRCITGGGPEETWRLEGVGAPHDIALAASPMPVQGTGERTLAVFVAETKPAGSMLRKFLFIPQGSLSRTCCLYCACWQLILAWGGFGNKPDLMSLDSACGTS